jgi:hypothetical protein
MSFYYARRNHGKLLMWGSQVDQWCRRIAREKHMVQISSTECAPIPLAVRGVMHGTVPRLNKYLDRYADALDRHGEWNDIPNRKQTVVSLQALPIGPYSERLPTHVAENADPTASARFRNPDDAVDCAGLAFQTDATCSETSILREPLFARPAVTCPADNPFANVQSYATTFFGAAAAIAYEARCALLLRTARTGEQPTPRAAQQLAKAILNRLHDPSMPPPESPFDYRIGIAICNLLHFVYPWKRGVAEPIVRWSYAHAAAAVRKTPELNLVALERKRAAKNPKADPNDLEVALAWWSCFARERHSAWDALAPLLERILEANGSFDNTLADIDAMAADLETAVRGVWCVESPDGVQAPPPGTMLEGALTPAYVQPRHLNPVFVGSTDQATGVRTEQRASAIGTMPMAFQQALALLTAADVLDGTVVQVYVNEGALAYRASAAADVLTINGKERSAKAISCVGVEGDEAAFGTRADRLESGANQREAWRLNLDLVFDLMTTVSPPKGWRNYKHDYLARGDRASFDYIKTRKVEADRARVATKQEIEASAIFRKATRATLEQ